MVTLLESGKLPDVHNQNKIKKNGRFLFPVPASAWQRVRTAPESESSIRFVWILAHRVYCSIWFILFRFAKDNEGFDGEEEGMSIMM